MIRIYRIAILLFAVCPCRYAGAQTPPITEEAASVHNARRPTSDADLRAWLENMVVYHHFSDQEIRWATGLSTSEIESAIERFELADRKPHSRQPTDPLTALPYPGGRHPRIGFLDGALRPQRETKISVFTPWDPSSYVVIDVPEAIWSNLGLTYLAHTHIPTVWDQQGLELPAQEWQITNGLFRMQRTLPNGIEFGTIVQPHSDHVQMEMWLRNGSQQALSDLRVQNCVMLRGAKGFEQQTNDNKHVREPYVCCKSADGQRWVIAAWEPVHRAWANAPCPCLHSDPKFPDTEPGETKRLRGWLSFYEGPNIDDELRRIDGVGWKSTPYLQPSLVETVK